MLVYTLEKSIFLRNLHLMDFGSECKNSTKMTQIFWDTIMYVYCNYYEYAKKIKYKLEFTKK